MQESTKKRYDEIMRLRTEGYSLTQIANRLHISSPTVSYYLNNRAGIALNDYGLDRRRKLTRDQISELIRRRAAGERVCDLAKHFGISTTCVEYYTLPGCADNINAASKERTVRLLKEQPDFRKKRNAAQVENNRRRVELINKIHKGEITK